MKPEIIINELIEIEAMCDVLKKKAYSTRKHLESVYSPAPKGAKQKGESDFIKKFRLSVAKRQVKAQNS